MRGIMPMGMEWAVIAGTFVIPLIELAVVAVVLYFVIKRAVRAALREHDEERGPSRS